jgi:ribulose-phosphate 3-epimerase
MRTDSRTRFRNLRGDPLVLPSVLSADFAALAASIAPLEDAGAPALHLDVMDGHFVPNITFGPPLVKSIRTHTRGFLDTHLMITDPLKYLARFAEAGSDLCTVHAEIDADPLAVAAEARAAGLCLGVAIRPSTPLDPMLERWAPHVDLILVMSVEPGFGGQSFHPEAVSRLRRTSEICRGLGVDPVVEVDGGIGPATARQVLDAGARWLVAGSAVFHTPDPVEAWKNLSAFLPY